MLKSVWEFKGTRITRTTLKNYKIGGLTHSDLKTCYNITIINRTIIGLVQGVTYRSMKQN